MASERPGWHRFVVAGLLACQALLLLVSLRRNFVTLDEAGHVPSGLVHWQTGTFSAYCVNPPLPRMLATLPLLVVRPTVPLPRSGPPGYRPEWDLGPEFASANAERYFDLVCLARLAGVGWALLGGWLVYRWSSELFGGRAGLLSLALWCFEPNILAHAQLVTADVPAAVAGLAAGYLFWRYLRHPGWAGAWFAGLALGLAELTKATWLILYGLWPLLTLLWRRWGERTTLVRPVVQAGQVGLILVVSWLALNTVYGWQGTGRPLGEFRFVSRLLAGADRDEPEGNRFHGAWLAHLPVPAPADYLLGLDVQRRDFEAGWPFYFRGEWRQGGRWDFYLHALTLKVPLGVLVLVLAALLLFLLGKTGRHPRAAEALLWLPAMALLLLISSQTGLNYLRYALPFFPLVLVAAGKLAVWRPESKVVQATVLSLACWAAVSSLAVFPHHLAYFNETAGGPDHAHEHLVDSNLDWGQDLLALKVWLDQHPDSGPLRLAYFNHVDPRLVGLKFGLPPVAREADSQQRQAQSCPRAAMP